MKKKLAFGTIRPLPGRSATVSSFRKNRSRGPVMTPPHSVEAPVIVRPEGKLFVFDSAEAAARYAEVPDVRPESHFFALALRAIEATCVPRLVSDHSAVVLERIARGAGATRWYYLERPEQLAALADRLAPGSSLSFYFDDRIARKRFAADVAEDILRVVSEEGDAVVGRLGDDAIEIAVEFAANRREVEEIAESLKPQEPIFFGRFPGRDSDSIRAVTLDLPDRDGVVRQHPH